MRRSLVWSALLLALAAGPLLLQREAVFPCAPTRFTPNSSLPAPALVAAALGLPPASSAHAALAAAYCGLGGPDLDRPRTGCPCRSPPCPWYAPEWLVRRSPCPAGAARQGTASASAAPQGFAAPLASCTPACAAEHSPIISAGPLGVATPDVALWCSFGAPSALLPGHPDLQPSWLSPPAVAAPPLHGQERPRAESGALPPIAPVRPPSTPPTTTTPDGAVAPGRSSEQVLLIPYLSLYLAKGLNRTDDQTARATASLRRGDANVRGDDPTFAHHVAQPLASPRAAAPPLQPVSPAMLPWPHRPTQLLASLLVTPMLGVPTNNVCADTPHTPPRPSHLPNKNIIHDARTNNRGHASKDVSFWHLYLRGGAISGGKGGGRWSARRRLGV